MPTNSQAKNKTQPSTQEYLEIAEIRDSVVIMKDGSLRMVILIRAVNFSLKSEEEQNAIVMQYQNFLNSLNFPIQIILQSRRTDLTAYLAMLQNRLYKEKNELIRLQIGDYIEFIKRLIGLANIMDKKFFVIVPLFPPGLRKRGIFDKILNPKNMLSVKISDVEFNSFREELTERVNVIMNGLGTMGVRSAPLNTQQLIEMYYACYNPEEAVSEKLTEIKKLESAIITKKVGSNDQDSEGKSDV